MEIPNKFRFWFLFRLPVAPANEELKERSHQLLFGTMQKDFALAVYRRLLLQVELILRGGTMTLIGGDVGKIVIKFLMQCLNIEKNILLSVCKATLL